jgi:hypothetical protein
MSFDRRSFILAGGAAFLDAQAPVSDQISLGVIGSGGRGTFVMTVFQKDASVKVGAICDVYEPNLEKALSLASKDHPKAYRNYKALLDDKSVQAVLIATPEHWHHRMVLDALAAGKDIYIEKPLCQTPEQGVELVDAENRRASCKWACRGAATICIWTRGKSWPRERSGRCGWFGRGGLITV